MDTRQSNTKRIRLKGTAQIVIAGSNPINGEEYAGVVVLTGTFARPVAQFKITIEIGGKPTEELHLLRQGRRVIKGVPEDHQFTLPFQIQISQDHFSIFSIRCAYHLFTRAETKSMHSVRGV